MIVRKKILHNLKKQAGALLNVLITEHAKLTIIIIITLVVCLFLYLYKHPASVPVQSAPIEMLPRTLGSWTGEDVFLAVPMKNNRYCSAIFSDAEGHRLRFISYQRQNEKHEQLHYPEDCLRANGYFDVTTNIVTLRIGDRTTPFKHILASRGTQNICHYYVIFSGDGEILTYGAHRQDYGLTNFQKLVERRLQFHRNNDQLFLFTITGNAVFSGDTATQVQSLLQAMPVGFFPTK